MTKRLALPALLLAVLLVLSGCGQLGRGHSTPNIKPTAESLAPPKVLTQVRLPWFGEDTLNPYSCETLQNFYLAGLLCDGLVALDSQNQPQNRLASDVSGGPLAYTVTLRTDATFSDGARLTAEDVLYSLELARQSPRFAAGLAGVSQAVATGPSTLSITLTAPDQYFARSLSFPVLRTGTADFPVPVAVGRFTPQLEQQQLVHNDDYYSPVQNVREVQLVDTASLEEQSYGIMEGTIDLMYSDLQSDLNLGLGMAYRQIPLSNMVYLKVNALGLCGDRGLRQALSGLVRREELTRRAYTSFGAVTSLPLPPYAASSLNVGDLEVQPERQKQALEALGWVAREDGSRWREGRRLSLTLLANTESAERRVLAELLAESWRQAGIEVTVTLLPYDQYTAAIAAGAYDLCIAETKISYNMDIRSLILASGEGLAGPPYNPSLANQYAQVRAGEEPLEALETTLRQELPVIPLLFRRGILCFSRDFSANIVATEQDIFYNIGEW